MEIGLEQANERRDTRAQDTERRLARPDPAQQPPEPELAALPQAEPLDDLLPLADEGEQLPAAAQQAQQQDQELLEATKAWLETGDMPEQFDKAMVEWTDKNTGGLRRASIGELKEGNLRQSEFSNRMGQVRQYEQQLQFREQANNQFWNTIKEPEKMLEELENRGYDEVFEKAAITFAQRRSRMKQVAEAAGYALMQQYGYQANHPDVVNAVRQTMQAQQQSRRIEIENRKLQQHNQMLAQMRQHQDTQAQQQVRMQQLGNSLAQLIPASFKSAGVRANPANTEAFYRHLNAYVSSLPNWDGNVRRQHCVEAAKMVREELEDLAAARAPKQQAQQSRAMPPSRLGSSGSAQPTSPDRKRLSDMQNDGRFGFG